DVVLTESGGQVVSPGGKLTLTCTGSGYTFKDYDMSWVRQAPQKGWNGFHILTRLCSESVKGRFSISRDNDSNTAVYHCARDSHIYCFYCCFNPFGILICPLIIMNQL
uniref:Ig-like domain-containing protein n=1 Tax=Scleropages formosus TaxID=113540 RepID=A0A8C9VS64_SCLFO